MSAREPNESPRPVQDALFGDDAIDPAAAASLVGSAESRLRRATRERLHMPLPAPPDDGQLDLFAPSRLLAGDVTLAIARADFAAAITARSALIAAYPDAVAPGEFDFLDILAPCSWDPPSLAAHVSAWRRAEERIESESTRRHVARALFSRLLQHFSPGEIAARGRASLIPLLSILWDAGHVGMSRLLVRDALLRGVEVGPDDVEDSILRDVLAEDGCPQRLACLGEIRRTWAPDGVGKRLLARITQTLDEPLPTEASQVAKQCWDCLCVSDARPVQDAALVQRARQRLRLLDAELHALHTGGRGP